jgi:hypothetical protein
MAAEMARREPLLAAGATAIACSHTARDSAWRSSHRVAGAEQLWEGYLRGAVRIRAMVRGQPERVRARIRAAFDRQANEHATDGGVELPVSVKLAAGRKP